MKRIIYTLSALFIIAGSLSAQNMADTPASSTLSLSSVLEAIDVILMCLVIYLLAALYASMRRLRSLNDNKFRLSWWDRFAGLKSEKSEQELIMDEDYDGISELDNPTPPWFNFIFYTTVIFAVLYLLNYHVFKFNKLQESEYIEEVNASKIAVEAYLKKSGNLIDENTVTLLTDNQSISAGAKNFKEKCVVCHGEKAEGKVGPNLTDFYWIHGGDVKSIFKTIKYGVPAKGMITWNSTFSGKQIQQLASYVKSLKGTNPPNPKEPQGDLFKEDSTAVQTNVDTMAAVKAISLK